jgi:LysR family glycine cleavage system transcriptional activator
VEADIAIRVGTLSGKSYDPHAARVDLTMEVDWRGVLAEELAPDILVPVMSPALASDDRILADPSAIAALPLIHTTSRPHAWPDWMHALKMPAMKEPRKLEYGHFFMSLKAARQGEGVAIVPDLLLRGTASLGLVSADACKVRSAGLLPPLPQ